MTNSNPKKPNKHRPPRSKQLHKLKTLYEVHWYIKNPRFNPGRYDKSATSTNGLTRCVMDWLKFSGHQSERVSSTGQYRPGKKIQSAENSMYSGAIIETKGKFVRSTSRKGTADISATIEGRSVKIEIKNKYTNDRMSKDQIAYGIEVNQSGGLYVVVDTFDNFVTWYEINFMSYNKHIHNLTDPNIGRFAVKGQFYEVLSIEEGICTYCREIMPEKRYKEDLNKLAERLQKVGATYFQKGFGRELIL